MSKCKNCDSCKYLGKAWKDIFRARNPMRPDYVTKCLKRDFIFKPSTQLEFTSCEEYESKSDGEV